MWGTVEYMEDRLSVVDCRRLILSLYWTVDYMEDCHLVFSGL